MRVDVGSLATFNRLTHEGAEFAASSLQQLTSLDPCVEATRIDVVSPRDVGEEVADRAFVGVEIDFVGGMAGTAVLALERDGADVLLDAMPGPVDDGALARSKVEELGNILLAGFVDGWADHLGTTIDITPPSYVEGTGRDVLPPGADASNGREQVFAFTSRLGAPSASATAFIYMFPDVESISGLADDPGGSRTVPVSLEKLAVFNRMANHGARNASEYVTSMTGIDASVDVSRLSYVPIEDTPKQVSCGEYVGTIIEFEGVPSGHVAILFDESSARSVVAELLPDVEGRSDGGERDPFDEEGRSAIREIGNVMTSGFVDGWANVLETTIDISTPTYVHDMGRAILDPIAVRLGRSQDFAFLIDSTIETRGREIECDVFALPDGDELGRALESISIPAAGRAENEASPYPGMEACFDDL